MFAQIVRLIDRLNSMGRQLMSPRSYQLGKRQEQVDEVRQRVITSARSLLAGSTSYTDFTIDAVAKKADVARATVYYQFESKTGLLEAICDSMAVDGRLFELEAAFRQADPHRGLRQFVESFARFWAVDRLAMRRLRALSALDPEVGSVIKDRDRTPSQRPGGPDRTDLRFGRPAGHRPTSRTS